MSLPLELLRQARHLATKEPRRPLQASLRRSISTAYYALFHLLVSEGAAFLVRRGPRLREAASRAFEHGEMKAAAVSFAAGSPPAAFARAAGRISPELKGIAEAFVALQQARHEADYDVSRTFSKREALDFVEQAERAFEAWAGVRKNAEADAFLLCLLLKKRLDR